MRVGPDVRPVSLGQDGPRTLVIEWSDGHRGLHDVRRLRLACRCAQCIDEFSGRALLDPARVPETIRPLRIEPVGLYGLQIEWNDGHGTGIYTYDVLGSLCECGACRQEDPRA